MHKISAAELPDLILDSCPLGCYSVCAQIWRNEVTGHRIVCKCSCKHKWMVSMVEEPETVNRTRTYRNISKEVRGQNE